MIIYVAGDMHSGTTLVGQLIAAHLPATMVGEVNPTLLLGASEQVCDCGRPGTECAVWSQVTNTPTLRAATSHAYRMTRFPGQFARALLRTPPHAHDTVVVRALEELVNAVDQALIDTSKLPTGLLLWRMAGRPVAIVHCVRDPISVARSKRSERGAPLAPRRSRLAYLAMWAAVHAATLICRLVATRYVQVRFADLLDAPDNQLQRIARTIFAVEPPAASRSRSFLLARSHIVYGNPGRVRSGQVAIRTRSEVSTNRR